MKLMLNRTHLKLWATYAVAWIGFVVFCLIFGWHLKPRPDEVLFVATLPIWAVFLPYVVFCLLAAIFKSLWPVGRKRLGFLGRFRRLNSDE